MTSEQLRRACDTYDRVMQYTIYAPNEHTSKLFKKVGKLPESLREMIRHGEWLFYVVHERTRQTTILGVEKFEIKHAVGPVVFPEIIPVLEALKL